MGNAAGKQERNDAGIAPVLRKPVGELVAKLHCEQILIIVASAFSAGPGASGIMASTPANSGGLSNSGGIAGLRLI